MQNLVILNALYQRKQKHENAKVQINEYCIITVFQQKRSKNWIKLSKTGNYEQVLN